MIRVVYSVLFSLSFACLVGCTSTTPAVAAQADSEQAIAASEVPASGLGPQALAPGDCGLFLWSKTDESSFIFFSRAVSGVAVFKPEEEVLNLQQIGTGGTIFGQFNTQQSYAVGDGSLVEVTFDAGDTLTGGQRISDGLITITDREGWRTKLPVLGLRACMPEG